MGRLASTGNNANEERRQLSNTVGCCFCPMKVLRGVPMVSSG